jgi:hypothetical protein
MRPLDLLDQARPRSTHAARAQHARTQARAREEGLTAAGQKPKKGPDQEHGEAVPRAAVRRGAARAPPGRHGRRRQRPAPPGVSRPRSALFGTRVARWAGPVLIRFFFSRGVPQGYALSKWLRTKIHRLISLQVVLARVLGAVATRAARHRSPRSRARPRTERRGLGGGQGARADKMREEQAKVRRASEAAAREAALPDARRDRRAGDLTLTDLNLEDEPGRAPPRAPRPARPAPRASVALPSVRLTVARRRRRRLQWGMGGSPRTAHAGRAPAGRAPASRRARGASSILGSRTVWRNAGARARRRRERQRPRGSASRRS